MNKILYAIIFIFLVIFSCFDYSSDKQDSFDKTVTFVNQEDNQEYEDAAHLSLPALNANSGIDLSGFEFINPATLKQWLKSIAEIGEEKESKLQSTPSFDCKNQAFFIDGLGCIDAKRLVEAMKNIDTNIVNCTREKL